MTALRAFLMLANSQGNWSITVHRDIAGILDAWKDRVEPETTVGVLHLGFDRPATQALEALISGQAGRLLVTGAAKHGLPLGFSATDQPLGFSGSLPIFLATKGWGYLLDEQVIAQHSLPLRSAVKDASGWVRDFLDNYGDAKDAFIEAEIHDENSYLAREHSLEFAHRHSSGLYRFRYLIGLDEDDPCAFARAAPPWLAERSTVHLDLTVRISNVFSLMGISRVGDLAKTSLDTLLSTKNFGRKSVTDLLKSLNLAIEAGPLESGVLTTTSTTFLDCIRQSLGEYRERERDIVSRRMGLYGPPETLQEIGDSHGVTRERVRQIESKILRRILERTRWKDLLSLKLKRLLQDREVPMPVLGIEAADPWFAGVALSPDVLEYALSSILDGVAGDILSIDGIQYVGFLTQDRWDAAIHDAQKLLESSAGRGLTETHCKRVVEALLPSTAREFANLLWDKAARFCHFVPNNHNEKILSTYGRGVESLVEAILQASDTPIHYAEIVERAKQRSGRDIEIRRAHNAAAEVGLLLGRGTFGLERHLPLGHDDLIALGTEAEELVLDGHPERQWHASGILASLIERGSHFAPQVDKYVVDISLQKLGSLKRLGRMVWARNTHASDIARIDVRQAIIAVLQQAGRPLRASDIRQRLIALRGINDHFQIFAAEPLIRIAPGWWGLNDRDVDVKRADQPAFIEYLLEELERRQEGFHISELEGVLAGSFQSRTSMVALFSLAALDERLRTDASEYLYLAKWGESRRQSIGETVTNILRQATTPLLLDEIMQEARIHLKRDVDRRVISSYLQSLNATYDATTLQWTRGSEAENVSNDEEQMLIE